MAEINNSRIAWLVPTMASGAHWQPLVQKFSQSKLDNIFFTTQVWPEFSSKSDYAKFIELIGCFKKISLTKNKEGYDREIMVLPISLIFRLAKYKPSHIITSAFSIWSLIAVLAKLVFGWKVIVLYEGSTPNADFKDSLIRSVARRLIARFTDFFLANNSSASSYLQEFLEVKEEIIFQVTYLLPDVNSLLTEKPSVTLNFSSSPKTRFLYIGQVISRKGIDKLLEACYLLSQSGIDQFELLIAGDGLQIPHYKDLVSKYQIDQHIRWIGRVNYGALGYYINFADVFVFPSLEDTWGMTVLEAMSLGKPILCSILAGASEMVIDGENGFLFDPRKPQDLANLMLRLIKSPSLSKKLGENSKVIIQRNTLDKVVIEVANVIAMS